MKLHYLLVILLIGSSSQFSQDASNESGLSEMQVYRAILNRKKATYQDLADIILMERGEFGNFSSQKERVNQLRTAGIYDITENAQDFVTMGAVAKAIMNQFKMPKGLFFYLTRFERYAFRDLQDLQLVLPIYSEYSHLTGSQLIGIMTEADDFRANYQNWGKSQLEILELEEAKTKGEQ